ncbi:hypothetical protein [Chryseobacterium populi]|uniref:Uncharacterized protein n=1 Tax=Chryseobacterium populi TaxID=1144316 RepID=J2KP39_9FLAO|nr:hypothetical protein [Chryseobacterium populi]EJL74843.1 hypothetical protein PMI13_00722 [Chryseobacterium populi]
MLDFYTIKDHLPTSDYPDKLDLKFAGDLDDRTFSQLQSKEIVPRNFDYYSDFRWDRKTIQQICNAITDKNLESDTDVKKLMQLLNAAIQAECSLVAYGD